MRPKKIDILRDLMSSGSWEKALSLAAKFPNLGDHKADIVRGHEAYSNGSFYAQIGKDPAALISTGIEALKARYDQSKPS